MLQQSHLRSASIRRNHGTTHTNVEPVHGRTNAVRAVRVERRICDVRWRERCQIDLLASEKNTETKSIKEKRLPGGSLF